MNPSGLSHRHLILRRFDNESIELVPERPSMHPPASESGCRIRSWTEGGTQVFDLHLPDGISIRPADWRRFAYDHSRVAKLLFQCVHDNVVSAIFEPGSDELKARLERTLTEALGDLSSVFDVTSVQYEHGNRDGILITIEGDHKNGEHRTYRFPLDEASFFSEAGKELTVELLVEKFGLRAHPEGGYFRETYRSDGSIRKSALEGEFDGDRNYSTAIYFLLPEGSKSRLHRIRSDELWHFYLGGPLIIVQLFPDGRVEETHIGQDISAGQVLQHVVPAGCWFGAYPAPGTKFALVGCTVAPGFDFADFEMGKRAELLTMFPHARQIIERLTD